MASEVGGYFGGGISWREGEALSPLSNAHVLIKNSVKCWPLISRDDQFKLEPATPGMVRATNSPSAKEGLTGSGLLAGLVGSQQTLGITGPC